MTLLDQIIQTIETGWCQDDFAQTSTGQLVSYTDQHAKKFCLSGAILRVSYKRKLTELQLEELIDRVESQIIKRARAIHEWVESVFCFNDHPDTTKNDVLSLLREIKRDNPEW